MGRYTRKSKRSEEAAVMEKSAAEVAAVGRKRKAAVGETEVSTSSGQLKTRRLADNSVSSSSSSSGELTCEGLSCDLAMASCCSSNGVSSKFADLEEITNELVFATSAGDLVDFADSRDTTPSCVVQAESRTAAIMPSEDELEDFFTAAEKNLQKQFIKKYNYDIVKDEPLEGRYEWTRIQLKP